MASREDRGSTLREHGCRRVRRAKLEAFYRELGGSLERHARWNHGLSNEDASDVVHDAFLLALEKMRARGNATLWLIRVVDGLAANLVRTRLRRAGLLARWSPTPRAAVPDDEEAEVTE